MREDKNKSPAFAHTHGPLEPELISEETDDMSWVQHLRVPHDLSCWPGHFPQRAILPGVVQLSWAVALVQKRMQSCTPPTRIEALKFKIPVVPGQLLCLTVKRGSSEGRFSFEFGHAGSIHSKGRLVFARAREDDQ